LLERTRSTLIIVLMALAVIMASTLADIVIVGDQE